MRGSASHRGVSAMLFGCLFAAQAGAIALSPILAQVARDLDVSTAAAGQLRTIAGLVAGTTALAVGRLATRVGLGRLLLAGSVLLAIGSLASAAAPDIAVLAVAQVPVGAATGILMTVATLAVAEWVPPDRRAATLSWALVGGPAAWIVGMPLLGAAAEGSWRHAWLAFPLVAGLLSAVVVSGRSGAPPAKAAPVPLRATLAAPGVGGWLAAEVLANTAWAGTLVFAGALFVESYAASSALTGVLLAVGASTYVAGNLVMRRVAERDPRGLLFALASALAVATTAFGAVRPSVAGSTALFAAAAFLAGGRTFLSSAFGLAAPAEFRPGAMAMRAASNQFGYFIGSFAAGTALALGGYLAFGATIGALFLAAALVLRRSRAEGGHGVATPPREWVMPSRAGA